jgi:hypothetical protein
VKVKRNRRLLGSFVALCSFVMVGCSDGGADEEQNREVFEPITYEPTVEQDHVKDGVFTSEPYDIDPEE